MGEAPLRIALIRRSYRPDGGAEQIMSRTLDTLRTSEELDISLICERWQGIDEIRHLAVPRRGFGRVARHRHFVDQVSTILQEHRFDLVQSNERLPGCTLYRAGDGVHAQWLARRASVATSLQRRWLHISRFHRYMVKTEADMFSHPALRRVICISQMVRDDILRHYPVDAGKLRVIINGIDLLRFNPASEPAQRQHLRDELGLAPSPLLLFVGSGFERKGLTQLLHAMSNDGEWHLAVVGRDKHQARYLRLAEHLGLQERVHFTGVVPDVTPYYRCADLLVHPCLYEPFGNVVLEAMACGLGVVTNQYCGAGELIEQEVNGLLYDADCRDALGQTLIRAQGEFDAYRQPARVTAEQHPIEQMVEEMLELYRELLELPDGEGG
ncbi:MAG: glycosyltransferase family 4 protein [Candidatus Thiodiazotropha sp.]